MSDRAHGPGWTDSQTTPKLSVVVVTYNEADRIERCLDAVGEACSEYDHEIVLVDSRSTDGTVELARQYPVTIYRLPPSAPRTPGGGRYVGTQVTDGDRVLFVDGDMRIRGSWLDDALDVLATDPAVAGVDGHLNESDATETADVASLRGVALYDRDALAAVGGFDPYLHALEDIELGFRFAESGARLVRLPSVAATHPFGDGVAELRRRWRSGYYFGRGQVFRKWLRSPRMLARTLHYSRLYATIGGWVALAPIATVAAGGGPGLLAWCVATVALIALSLRSRGRRWLARKTLSFVPVCVGALAGFLGRHPPATSYPVADTELVRAVPQRPVPPGGGR